MADNQKQEQITLESLYAYLYESEEISKREFAQMRERSEKRAEESEKEWQKINEILQKTNESLQKAENFRKFLPRYNDRKLYLGIASLSFMKVTESKIMERGIAVIKQVGDKMVVYDKNLKVF